MTSKRARRVLHVLCERYCTVDRRLLAVFRIAFGTLLLVDVLRRLPYVGMLYSDLGVLPAWLARAHPVDVHAASPLFWVATPEGATACLLAIALIDLAYLLGYRTKLMQVLALLSFVSLDARNLLVENRGHIEMAIALLWTAFLPLGDCWSLDARRARRRGRARPAPELPVVSAAVAAITLQTAAIYLLNALQKGGAAWEQGDAVHYVLWQNRAASELAAWLRVSEPAWLSPLLSHGTRWGEGLAALLLLLPFAQRRARLAFFGLTFVLHLGIALLLNVWPHSFVIVCVNLLLLPRGLWAADRSRPPLPQPAATFSGKVRWPLWGREAAALALMLAASVQLARDNRVIASRLSLPALPLLEPLVGYARLYQDWSMFRRVPLSDGTLVIDALTADGRRIDPLRGAPPDFDAPLHGPWGYSQIECDYHFQIQRASRAVYLEGLANYLRSWHRLAGRSEGDELRRFEVYWVGSTAPPPGAIAPTPLEPRLLLRGP